MGVFNRRAVIDFLRKEELEMVSETVRKAEAKTSGEIRVKIMSGLDKGIKTSREQAIHEFYREGMDKTRDKTGVLILLVLSTRGIEILADAGINERVEVGTWDAVVSAMAETMRQGKRREAICQGVNTVGDILSRHFPRKPDDANEISDEVIQ